MFSAYTLQQIASNSSIKASGDLDFIFRIKPAFLFLLRSMIRTKCAITGIVHVRPAAACVVIICRVIVYKIISLKGEIDAVNVTESGHPISVGRVASHRTTSAGIDADAIDVAESRSPVVVGRVAGYRTTRVDIDTVDVSGSRSPVAIDRIASHLTTIAGSRSKLMY